MLSKPIQALADILPGRAGANAMFLVVRLSNQIRSHCDVINRNSKFWHCNRCTTKWIFYSLHFKRVHSTRGICGIREW